jgi:aryl-alcohol dehydrogenase-like predicted oxidoreductase
LTLGISGIDTAYNYRSFNSHQLLAKVAGDLLSEFVVSTKVGFFPGQDGHAVHSLRPERLWSAIEQAGSDLGRPPDVVFLHNPERSLTSCPAGNAADRLADACASLARAAKAGLCGSWGIASWEPQRLTDVVTESPLGELPSVLLVRAGLSVPDHVLTSAENARTALGITQDTCWGMSPFGGSTADNAWHVTDLSVFLAPRERCSTLQTAFRLAYELPSVAQVAVGTGNPSHLTELVGATEVSVNSEALGRYRDLIRART